MKKKIVLIVVAVGVVVFFAKGEKVNVITGVQSGHVVTVDQKKIYYDHYQNGHQKVIILAHGFYNSKQAVLFKDMAKMLSAEYDVIVFDFRGHGKSDGPFNWTAKSYQDLEAILDFANERYKRIGVVGFSLGAAASVIAASRSRLIDSLVAVSAPTEFGKINYHVWKMGIMENIVYNVFQEGRIGKGVKPGVPWANKIKPIDVIGQIKIPICFVHGKKDWLILAKHSEVLYNKCTSEKELIMIEDGTHAEYLFRRDRLGTIKIFKKWFKETL